MHPGCRRFWIVRTSCSCRICNCCQRGKLVRNDPHLPTRAVGRCPGISYCQRFRDRNAFIAFRKRIVRAAGHAFAAAEIEWAFCSRWSIENGPAVNRIAADGKFLGRVVGEHGRSGTAAESGQHRARRDKILSPLDTPQRPCRGSAPSQAGHGCASSLEGSRIAQRTAGRLRALPTQT